MVAAPSSNNVENAPDPECVSPRRESSGTFAMNAHIGADAVMDLVHTVKRTAANGADVSQVLGLLDGEEDRLHGDPVYIGVEKRLEGHRPEMHNARKRGTLRAILLFYAWEWMCIVPDERKRGRPDGE